MADEAQTSSSTQPDNQESLKVYKRPMDDVSDDDAQSPITNSPPNDDNNENSNGQPEAPDNDTNNDIVNTQDNSVNDNTTDDSKAEQKENENNSKTKAKALVSKTAADIFPVSVFVRVRPLVGDEVSNEHKSIEYSVKKLKKKGKSETLTVKNCTGKDLNRDKKYAGFTHVIKAECNNEYTFRQCILPYIDNIFIGLSTCAFAYGHTGSGKTHTIFGYNEEHGMYRLFAKELCQRVAALNDDTFIEIRFTELYQGIVRDLLSKEKTECFVREDDKGNIHLRGQTVKYDDGKVVVQPITSFHVTKPEEVDKYIMEGMLSRNVGKSTLHDKSSRSHAFLEFELVNQTLCDARIQLPDKQAEHDVFKRKYDLVRKGAAGNKSQLPKMEAKMQRLKGKIKELKQVIKQLENNEERPWIAGDFVFVDLAGNEYGRDVDNNNKNEEEEKERNEINKSLFALKECIRGLHNNKKHVPYRSSKLTMYLRKYLKGDGSKAIMITNIGPSRHYIKQTINTLQYCGLVANA